MNNERTFKLRRKTKILFIANLLIIFMIFSIQNSSNTCTLENFQKQYAYNGIDKSKEVKLIYNADNATLINGSLVSLYEIDLYRFESCNITFNYTDAINNKTIDGADANFTWYKKNDPSVIYNGTLINSSSGIYILDFNTSSREIGDYIIDVYIKITNYTKPTLIVKLSINRRSTKLLTLTGTTLKIERGTIFPILFFLEDSINGTNLEDFPLKWIMGYFSGELISLKDGLYMFPIPTSLFEIGSNIFILDSSSVNDYNIESSTVILDITWEKILGIDAPIFYAILIISIIVCVCILLYIFIKRLSKPKAIRKIHDSIKKIEKDIRPISITEIRSREEIYNSLFKKDWEKINKHPKITPKKPVD